MEGLSGLIETLLKAMEERIVPIALSEMVEVSSSPQALRKEHGFPGQQWPGLPLPETQCQCGENVRTSRVLRASVLVANIVKRGTETISSCFWDLC